MNLYDITKEMEFALSESIDPETGEMIDEAKFDLFAKLQGDQDTKIKNTCKYIKQEQILLKGYEKELKRIQSIIKCMKNKHEFLKNGILMNWNGKELEDEQIRVRRNTGTIEITKPEEIPDEFKVVAMVEQVKIDNKGIKNLILEGNVKVNYAKINPTLSIL